MTASMPSTHTHPFYGFLHFGRENELLEPIPWDDVPVGADSWVIVAELTSSSRRIKHLASEPTLLDAEAYLYSEDCKIVVQHWHEYAQANSDSELAASLRNQHSYLNEPSPVQRGDTAIVWRFLRYPFYQPLPDDDVKCRLVSTLCSSFLGHLSNLIQAQVSLKRGLDQAGVNSFVNVIEQGAMFAERLEATAGSDACSYAAATIERIDAGRTQPQQHKVQSAPYIALPTEVVASLRNEARRHTEVTVQCLIEPKPNDGMKAFFTGALTKSFVHAIKELLGNRRKRDGGLAFHAIEVIGDVLRMFVQMSSAVNSLSNESDGRFDFESAGRWLEQQWEEEAYGEYPSPAVSRAARRVLDEVFAAVETSDLAYKQVSLAGLQQPTFVDSAHAAAGVLTRRIEAVRHRR